MEPVTLIFQIVIATGILNVWVLRPGRATAWRGGTARNMSEEFAVYGMPAWVMRVVGAVKIVLAVLLIAAIWLPHLQRPVAIALGALMLVAVVMHVKVKDPAARSLPAGTMLLLCLFVAGS